MSTDGKMAPPVTDAVQLSRVRTEELLTRVGAGLPPDVRRELAVGLEAILVDAINQFSSHRPDTNDFLSIAEAATQLFVSRPHISKLLEQGKLELHHESGSDRFITKASVLDYRAALDAAADAYQASAAARFLTIIGVPEATAEKKAAAGELVSGAGGQAAIGMIKLLGIAQGIAADSTAPGANDFDSARWLGEWIERPQPALGGRKPSELIDTPAGVDVVARLLGSLESGAYQ